MIRRRLASTIQKTEKILNQKMGAFSLSFWMIFLSRFFLACFLLTTSYFFSWTSFFLKTLCLTSRGMCSESIDSLW